MNGKSIVIGTVAGGILLWIVMFVIDTLVGAVLPYDIFSLDGMRTMDDPMMALFFISPFVTALVASIAFGMVKNAFKGTAGQQGLQFGILLFLIYTIPNVFIVYASMNYPAGFFASNLLNGIIGFPLLGFLLAKTA